MNYYDELQQCQNAERAAILTYERIFDILNNKEIDIWLLKVCDYDNYCRIRTKCLETNVESMVDCDEPAIPLPTKEEFDLLKEWLK